MHLTHFKSDNLDVTKAYYTAISDVVANIRPFQDGLLAEKQPVLIAGYGYDTPWTRDAAINTMHAGALLFPEEAKNTLLAVLKKEDGKVSIDGQYWDAIIWVWGAWEYFKVTNDKDFLPLAYEAAINSLAYFESTEFDPEKNLFRGNACYGDGISSYPDIYATHGESGIISFATECRELCVKQGVGIPMFTLSTNCLYYWAYVLADKMAALLNKPARYTEKAAAMKAAINRWFWMEEEGRYRYLVDPFGNCDHMEGIGHAFTLLFGVAEGERAEKVLKNQHITANGIACVWPTFDRYRMPDGKSYGRHSGTIWPHIQSFWADTALQHGYEALFEGEFERLTRWAVRDGYFAEIYHPDTGEVYGGRQEEDKNGIREWVSCKKQTWTATGYLHMIFADILGVQFEETGVRFAPYLPEGVHSIEISDLIIRGHAYTISVTGCGHEITSFKINQKDADKFLPYEE